MPQLQLLNLTPRTKAQLDFVTEIDALKTVLRRSVIADRSRRENTAEHSWHLGVMAIMLAEHSKEPVDLLKVAKMALVHDLVEIDAGDTFLYDQGGHADKFARETKAAERIFGVLPPDQGAELKQLWYEYEEQRSPESHFVRVLDRLQPVLLHRLTSCASWRENNVRKAQVLERMADVKNFAPSLWSAIEQIVDDAVREGNLLP